MAIEFENNLVASLVYQGITETIIAQQGIANVTRTATGVYLVELDDEIGVFEEGSTCAAFALTLPPPPAVGVTHEKDTVNLNQYTVRGWDDQGAASAPTNLVFAFNVWRLRTGVQE